MDQGVPGGRVGGLEPHGQGPEAALGGAAERLAALEQVLVEVEADIRLQTLWETLQDLRGKHGSKQTWRWSEVTRRKRFIARVCVWLDRQAG